MLTVYIDDKVYRFPLLLDAKNALQWAIIKGEGIEIIGIVDGRSYDTKFQLADYLRLTNTPWETIYLVSTDNWMVNSNREPTRNLDNYLVRDCPFHTNNPHSGMPTIPNSRCTKCDPYQ